MFSLFEEQIRERAERTYRLVDDPADFPEALDYFPSVLEKEVGPAATWTCWSARSRPSTSR